MEDIPLYVGKRKNILIISGGGIKGLAALGALKYLLETEIIIFPEIFCGTSVGSIICMLINIGYGPFDIYKLLEEIDFASLINYEEPESLLFDPCFGISSPEPIIQVLYNLIQKKNLSKKITFKQLFNKSQSKLIITGTCLNDATVAYFSVDNTPNMEIMKAIRISMSIPFIFKPSIYENKIWIDGGCMDNYPIELFNNKLDDVIGIYMDDIYEYIEDIPDIQSYFSRVIKCIFRGLNYHKLDHYQKYTINIISNSEQSTKWEMNKLEKKKLYDLGYKTALDYIQKYNL